MVSNHQINAKLSNRLKNIGGSVYNLNKGLNVIFD